MSSPALCEKRFVRMVARTAIHYTSASARRLGFWTTSEKIGTPCRVAWQKCFGNRCKDTLLWKALPPCPKNCGSMQLRCRRFATIFRRNVLGPRLHTVERRYNKTCGQLHSLQKPMAFGGCRHLSRVNAQKSKNNFQEARMRAISSRKSCSEHR